jgi:hypothetical protein
LSRAEERYIVAGVECSVGEPAKESVE